MEGLFETMSKMVQGEHFELNGNDIRKLCESTFPKRASTTPNSDVTSFFVTPRSWHYDEYKEHFKNFCDKEGYSVVDVNDGGLLIIKRKK